MPGGSLATLLLVCWLAFVTAGRAQVSSPVPTGTASPGPGASPSPVPSRSPVPSPSPSPWKNSEARKAFDEGARLQEEGLFPYAIDQYLDALQKEPRAEIQRRLGECFQTLDQPVLAAKHFGEYVRLVPSDADAVNRLGCAQLKLKRYAEALTSFRRLAALWPEVGRTGIMTVLLAEAGDAFDMARYSRACQLYERALEVGGTDARAVEGLRRTIRVLVKQPEVVARPAVQLDYLLKAYEFGELDDVKEPLRRAFVAAGKPARLKARVTRVLADPRLK